MCAMDTNRDIFGKTKGISERDNIPQNNRGVKTCLFMSFPCFFLGPRLEGIAFRLQSIPSRLEAIASRLEAIAIRYLFHPVPLFR